VVQRDNVFGRRGPAATSVHAYCLPSELQEKEAVTPKPLLRTGAVSFGVRFCAGTLVYVY